MYNTVCFSHKSDGDEMKDALSMSNGGTSMFISIHGCQVCTD